MKKEHPAAMKKYIQSLNAYILYIEMGLAKQCDPHDIEKSICCSIYADVC
jgi:hypothetical protein